MKTQTIENEKDLMELLKEDVLSTDKNKILFQTGHFPVTYRSGVAIEDFSLWGDFSTYSLETAAKIASLAQTLGKDIAFAFIADDRSYESNSQMSNQQRSSARNHLYRLRNGENALLPDRYHQILKENGFSEKNVLRANHKKAGRESCLYFSEKQLIAKCANEKTECAKAYKSFLTSEFMKEFSPYLVSFIPDRCTGNICRGVLESSSNYVDASHVFMQTDSMFLSNTNVDKLWKNWGVIYRKE